MSKAKTEKKYNDVLGCFGMNRELSPDIAVLHVFLGSFYECTTNKADLVSKIEDCINKLEDSANITCKENDEFARKEIFEDFGEWFGGACLTLRRRSKFPIPINAGLIYKETEDKSNLLVHMLYPNTTELFAADKKKLDEYLFQDVHGIYNPLVSIISKTIFGNVNNTILDEAKKTNEKSEPQLQDNITHLFKEKWLKELCARFRIDFENHLTKPMFKDYDIYRRLNSLMLLLNFYTTLFMIFRVMNGEKVYILAKGSSTQSSTETDFHTSAIGSFSDIRERVFLISEDFYSDNIKEWLKEIKGITASNELKMNTVTTEDKVTIEIEKADWVGLRDALTSARRSEILDKIVIEYLQLGETAVNIYRKDLAKAFVDYSKKRASSARKISSIFSVQGQQAKFVYPQTSTHKYYAMSPELTELLLRLFLSEKNVPDASLDDFTQWMSDKYGIYVCYSAELVDFLNQRSIKVPVFSSFEQNRQDFIQTLHNIGAITKRSDNSYIVKYSGMVGDLN